MPGTQRWGFSWPELKLSTPSHHHPPTDKQTHCIFFQQRIHFINIEEQIIFCPPRKQFGAAIMGLWHVKHYTIALHPFTLTYCVIYIKFNSCSVTLLSLQFPRVMHHKFALEFLPSTHTVLKPYSTSQENVSRTTISPIIRGHRTQRLTHLLGRQGRHLWLIVRQLPMKVGLWDTPLALRDLVLRNLHGISLPGIIAA